ncbi:hypothetical protein ACFORJ_03795 [Corynebacterium hansenii]|uniref:Uncharacterized protein n=1 Tax=Corynebacterium hansenii TaxID=394964 RepID=A0ABV7ZPX3_9CORY|nr:hypothetical protein [Corynebacterium hansenii]WJY98876.1 hypothetical protein CHAN_01205 [Corynebacterium hansenii]
MNIGIIEVGIILAVMLLVLLKAAVGVLAVLALVWVARAMLRK